MPRGTADSAGRLYLVGAGWSCYAVAWAFTIVAVSSIRMSRGGSSVGGGADGAAVLGPLYADSRVYLASAPSGIVGFFVATAVIFTSFGVVHFLGNVVQTLGPARAEYAYLGLSAVAKTTLHLFLALTVLSQSDVGQRGSPSTSTARSQASTYQAGFIGAGLIIAAVTGLFCLIHFWVRRRVSSSLCTSDVSLSLPCGAGLVALRWVDYVVSAPLMYAVLSASWGLLSVWPVAVGSLCHAVGIVCAAFSETAAQRLSSTTLGRVELLWLHGLCCAVHFSSALALFCWAASKGVLSASLPLSRAWTLKSPSWYYVCWASENPRGNQDWQTWCDGLDREDLAVTMSGATDASFLYVVPAAVLFAAWSAAVHAWSFFLVRSASK